MANTMDSQNTNSELNSRLRQVMWIPMLTSRGLIKLLAEVSSK